MMPGSLRPELPDALRRLRDDLAALRLQLELPDSGRARAARDDIVGQTDDYLLPRLEQMDAPVLMVVGGSTGAGKSTILNSLVGAEVSPSGVLRPTTRGPVLVCHPDDVRWFEGDRILPGLPRVAGGAPRPARSWSYRLGAPTTQTLLDSPGHRLPSRREPRAFDTAPRSRRCLALRDHGGALRRRRAWEFLATARERGTALSIVLNRVPDDAEREVTAHLGEMIREERIDAVLLVVGETRLEAGRLPAAELAPVRRWLDALAADADARGDLIRRTLSGALRSLPARAGAVERAASEQLAAAADLRAAADSRWPLRART